MDQVLLFNSRLHLFIGKLELRWYRPFTMTQVPLHRAIEITHLEMDIVKVNGHGLKPCIRGDFHEASKEVFHLKEPSLVLKYVKLVM